MDELQRMVDGLQRKSSLQAPVHAHVPATVSESAIADAAGTVVYDRPANEAEPLGKKLAQTSSEPAYQDLVASVASVAISEPGDSPIPHQDVTGNSIESTRSQEPDPDIPGNIEVADDDVDIEVLPSSDIQSILMAARQDRTQILADRSKLYKATEEMRASLIAIWAKPHDADSAFLTFSKAYESMTSESSVERLNNMSQDKINTRQLCYLYQNLFAFAEICYFEEKSLVYALEFLEGSERYAKAALPGRRTLQFDAAAHYILARTYEFLKKPKEAVRHAKKALELYIADDADLLEIRELLYGPQECIPLEKLEIGQIWLKTAGIGCIVSCYTLLGRLHLKCQDYQEAWKQHDKLLAMSGSSYQAQETWRQSRNGSPAVAFSRAWRLASDLFAAKREFLGARSCLELVISQMMQQGKFEITGDGHEFLECAEQLSNLVDSKLDQDLENHENDLTTSKHVHDIYIIDTFVEDAEKQAKNVTEGTFKFPPCPKLAELLSLPAPASLQAIVMQRKAKTRWWW